VPGPAIGFLQEALRWWDHWLCGKTTGIMDEPMYRVWMEENLAAKSFHDCCPGRWVSEDAWPSPRIDMQRWVMNERRLYHDANLPPQEVSIRNLSSPQTAGIGAGSWCGFGFEGEMPTDQREDDGRSLTFDSDPLPERLEILGAAVSRHSFPFADFFRRGFVQLCEVGGFRFTDGRSA
jgi:predicted acyl esterase